MEKHLQRRYPNVVADAGYESEENYLYLETNGQRAFIKPSNYEKSKTRKWKKDIGRRENMTYLPEEDAYCPPKANMVMIQIREGGRRWRIPARR